MTDDSWRGKVGRLDNAEIEAFLAEPQIARLACLDAKGWPYVVPCWHEWDGDSFWVVPRERSAWARHLQRDPRWTSTSCSPAPSCAAGRSSRGWSPAATA